MVAGVDGGKGDDFLPFAVAVMPIAVSSVVVVVVVFVFVFASRGSFVVEVRHLLVVRGIVVGAFSETRHPGDGLIVRVREGRWGLHRGGRRNAAGGAGEHDGVWEKLKAVNIPLL